MYGLFDGKTIICFTGIGFLWISIRFFSVEYKYNF